LPTIERTAIEFAKRTEAIKAATVDYVYNLGANMSRQELAVLVGQIDFTQLVNELGYVSNVDKLTSRYVDILRTIDPIAPLSEEVLQALVATDNAFYLSKGSDLASTMKQELSRGALTGASRATMKEAIKDVSGFRPDQVETLVDTAQRTFSRSVTAAMTEEMPPDTTYIYIGPVDDKTRDVCVEMAAAGALTRPQIESQFPGSMVTGGGFNCRHAWRLETKKSDKLSGEGKAQTKLDDGEAKKGAGTPLQNQVDG
jgi:hypothetical protein